MPEKIKIVVGFTRLPLTEIQKWFAGSYLSYCTCGESIYSLEDNAKHWKQGCFDTPIEVEYTKEEILAEMIKQGKIK